ncbi:Spy/CpxP family protein refolding chaperone [Ancylobacter sp. G4_0304]|uniref:Spy/CpxP family protein refolding chaperone n=1 Tax=Ancylobacter sp. G4_0304 TaxID=3114289 RepID=UPI0039C6158E
MPKLLFALLLAAAGIAGLPSAHAQQTPPAPAPEIVELYTRQDAQAVLDARVIALKTVIGLTPQQAALWEPVEAAIRRIAADAAARKLERAKLPAPADFVALMERTADAEAVRASELKTLAAALKPLAAALSDEQKRRIPAFLGLRENAFGLPQPTAELWLFEEEQ